jgi:cephalosporin-C deacetylase-like acetyl esterase
MRPILIATFLAAALAAQPGGPALPEWNVLYGQKEFADAGRMFQRHLQRLQEEEHRRRSKRISDLASTADIQGYQSETRARLLEALGELPERTPLNPRPAGTLDRDGYRIEKVLFESRPRYYVTANVYVPKRGRGPFPAVLAPVGHWGMGKTFDEYQQLGVYLARRGYIVLVYDVPGQGERRQYFNPVTNRAIIDPGGSHWFVTLEHGYAGAQAILTGGNYASYLVWDGVRALDYLVSRPDVDAERLACTGTSGGGLQAELLSAFDPRIKVSIPVCYGGCNPDNPARPGLSMLDIDALIAPRPLLMIEATGDPLPGVTSKQDRHGEIEHLYRASGQADRTRFIVVDGPHGYVQGMQQAAYSWLSRWFQGTTVPEDTLAEPPTVLESAESLHASPGGEVSMSLGGETVATLNRAHARRLARTRGAALANTVQAAIALDLRPTPLDPRALGRFDKGAFALEKVVYHSEPDIFVPGVLMLPKQRGPMPAVVFVNEEGKATKALVDQFLKPLVEAGVAVLSIDPRGMGETDPEAPRASRPTDFKRFVHDAESGFFYDAMRVGRTVVGMRTRDVIRGVDYLASRPEIDQRRIGVIGHGAGGLLALYAAAFDGRIRAAAANGSLVSYSAVAESDLYTHRFGGFGPGFLRTFDLPDLVALAAPRAVLVVNAVDAQHRVLDAESARRSYAARAGLEVAHEATVAAMVDGYRRLLRE